MNARIPGLNREELDKIPQLPDSILKKIADRDSLEKVDRDVIDMAIQILKETKLRKRLNDNK